MSAQAEALLFDLGGVLIDVDFSLALKQWAAHSALSEIEIRDTFHFDLKYEQHERGELSSIDYFSYLAERLQLSGNSQKVEEGWNAIYVREITSTRLLVEQARRMLPCYAFTNTNESHMRRWTNLYPKVMATFDAIFASHRIGLRKPERAAFEYISQAIDVAPRNILFFDDLMENVYAAERAGLTAVLVRSTQDVAKALVAVGVA